MFRFEGRAGKGELHEVFSRVGVAWLAVAGVPSFAECGLFPSLVPWVELVSPLLDVVLAVLSILLAATMVRRLHDVGRSGFFLVFLAVPFIGGCCCGIYPMGKAGLEKISTEIPLGIKRGWNPDLVKLLQRFCLRLRI